MPLTDKPFVILQNEVVIHLPWRFTVPALSKHRTVHSPTFNATEKRSQEANRQSGAWTSLGLEPCPRLRFSSSRWPGSFLPVVSFTTSEPPLSANSKRIIPTLLWRSYHRLARLAQGACVEFGYPQLLQTARMEILSRAAREPFRETVSVVVFLRATRRVCGQFGRGWPRNFDEIAQGPASVEAWRRRVLTSKSWKI